VISFSSLAGVPVNYAREPVAPYGTRGRTHAFNCTPEFLRKLEACFDELFRLIPLGRAEIITSAGAPSPTYAMFPVGIDGAYGPETESGLQTAFVRLGLSGDINTREVWLQFLTRITGRRSKKYVCLLARRALAGC
jgi:hypothetical protein